ncbi:MAG: hypothetical protein IJ409_04655 [Lachnospiraceae bacterium]|nr:hypothetical protein [Lachnospiraceae bacterium]
MNKERKHTVWWLLGSMIMMIAGFILMPKIIKIISAKLYKYSSGEIIIYDHKPEIVRRDTVRGEE